jgi:hypothetical protein
MGAGEWVNFADKIDWRALRYRGGFDAKSLTDYGRSISEVAFTRITGRFSGFLTARE